MPADNSLVDRSYGYAEPVITSITGFVRAIFDFIPNLLGAILLLIIGKFIAKYLRKGIEKLLELCKVETISAKVGVSEAMKSLGLNIKVVEVFGILAYWVIYLAFILAAIEALGVQTISDIVTKLIAYIPNLIAALIVLLVGITAANFIKNAISHIKHGLVLGKLAYIVIIVFVSVSALEQIGIEISFFTDNIKIIIAGIALGLGLSFGLGGQERAKKSIDKFLDKTK
jgi:hypothetical protein